MVYQPAGIHLLKKIGKRSLYKSIEYSGGKKRVSFVEIIRTKGKNRSNIVRELSPASVRRKYNLEVTKKKRKTRRTNHSPFDFGYFNF